MSGTDISVYTQQFQAENLSWDLTPVDGGFVIGGTLDLTAFNQAQHFANGYLPSGTVLGLITASGKLGPYLSTATDGRQTAVGILRASVKVVQPNGTLLTSSGAAALVHGYVSASKLPFTSATAALGGYLDAAAQTALRLIYVTA